MHPIRPRCAPCLRGTVWRRVDNKSAAPTRDAAGDRSDIRMRRSFLNSPSQVRAPTSGFDTTTRVNCAGRRCSPLPTAATCRPLANNSPPSSPTCSHTEQRAFCQRLAQEDRDAARPLLKGACKANGSGSASFRPARRRDWAPRRLLPRSGLVSRIGVQRSEGHHHLLVPEEVPHTATPPQRCYS
jgi:hypothetical protein